MLGVSSNFSSGDGGDETYDQNDPVDYPSSVNTPADLPYATGVGGVSLALNPNHSIQWQTGWGNNENGVVVTGFIEDPPTASGNGFFVFGAGGGGCVSDCILDAGSQGHFVPNVESAMGRRDRSAFLQPLPVAGAVPGQAHASTNVEPMAGESSLRGCRRSSILLSD